jgi:hypothetical protein
MTKKSRANLLGTGFLFTHGAANFRARRPLQIWIETGRFIASILSAAFFPPDLQWMRLKV